MAYVPNSGSVVAFQGTVPFSVLGNIAGSVVSFQGGTQITSVSGVVNTAGSVVAFQGTSPWIVTGSVQATLTPAVNQSVSGTVGASLIGLSPVSVSNFPTSQNVSGSVVAFQGTNPFIITGSVQGSFTPSGNQSVSGTVQTDVRGSVATVIIGGSIAASFTPPANQSVSGTVGASLIGLSPVSVSNFPTNQNVSGSVVAFQGTNPWIITGSVQASLAPAANQSVSGTVGASLIGLSPVSVSNFPTNQNVSGSVVAFQGAGWSGSVAATVTNTVTVVSSISGGIFPISGSVAATITNTNLNVGGSVVAFQGGAPWANTNVGSVITVGQSSIAVAIVSGSIAASFTPPANQSVSGTVGASLIGLSPVSVSNFPTSQNVSGSVVAFQGGTQITSLVSTVPSSVLVGASIFGQLPAGTAMIGSIAAYQGSVPWAMAGSVAAFQAGVQATSIQGTVSVLGTVPVTQSGAWAVSVLGSNPSSLLVGNYSQRNDAVSSFLGGNLTWNPLASDSAGRMLTKPFASEDATIISYVGSIVSGSVQLIQASAIGKRSYITDFWLSNTGAATTLVTFQGGDTSLVGQFIAPTGGGMSSPGLAIPLKTTLSQDLAFKVSSATSVLYVVAKGYQAP